MPPEGNIARASLLEVDGDLARSLGPGRIRLRSGGGGRIDLLEIAQGHRRPGRVRVGPPRIEVGKFGMPSLDLGDDESHLQAPVTEMGVPDDFVALQGKQPGEGITDDGGS